MILIAYGTRPEYIKVKPVIDLLGDKCKILFTGQHSSLFNTDWDYNMDPPDGVNRLDSIVEGVMNGMDFTPYTHVMVHGDTTSAMAVALSAFHQGVPVIHLEAGLRTYRPDPHPEEANRRIISQLASIHLCPTSDNWVNLENEQMSGSKHIVGNTAIDNIVKWKKKAEYGDSVLVTMHRRENLPIMDEWFIAINNIAKRHDNLKFIIPLHPNPDVQEHAHLLTHVDVISPLPREELLDILSKARVVITDSGGIQEECSYLNKKCLTCRESTERPEALFDSTFLVRNPGDLFSVFESHVNDYEISYPCPFGDGDSAQRVYNVLKGVI